MKFKLKYALYLIIFIFFFNEYLIYWFVISACSWSNLDSDSLKVMLIADTHLLGSRNGHWFDKLRREWQQYRAFQTAQTLLSPNMIVILGDLTDEGKWCSNDEWKYYETRTQELFKVDSTRTRLFILVGNHDVGFHFNLNTNKIERFNRSFTKQFVHLQTIDKLNFVFLNSMTLENDGCNFCRQTQIQLKAIERQLSNRTASKSIIFTHFPLYRQSNEICPYDVDSEPSFAHTQFQQNYDCLSKESTKQLIQQLKPRLVFSAHTHYSCFNKLNNVPEYTVASFSWRNINTPSMLLVNHFKLVQKFEIKSTRTF